MIPAIILAAGSSTRMRTPKPLLADATGRAFVERIVITLGRAGLSDIVVVSGAHHALITAVLEDARLPVMPRVVRNTDPDRGQLSSLLCGMDVLPEGTPAVLVTLVDVPFVAVRTVESVIDAWAKRRPAVVRPALGDRHGHPVIFDRRVFEALREAPLEEGAKRVIRDWKNEVEDVQVDDEGCVIDVDTPEDYRRLVTG